VAQQPLLVQTPQDTAAKVGDLHLQQPLRHGGWRVLVARQGRRRQVEVSLRGGVQGFVSRRGDVSGGLQLCFWDKPNATEKMFEFHFM
jgi:hypothetical protein